MAKVILTIELDDAQELSRVSALLAGAPAPEMAVKVYTSKLEEALKASIAKKESPAKETPAEAAHAEADPAQAAEKISLEDLQRAFRQKRTKENVQLLKEIVQAHGGARLSEVPEDRRPALMAELDALVVD